MVELKVGDIVEGKVSGIQNYGIFITLADGYSGLIHISEVSEKFVNNLKEYVDINEKINVKIVEIDEKTKQCKLSIKNVNYIKVEPHNDSIEEVGSGFESLKKSLNIWIDEKKDEIYQEKNKKIKKKQK